MFCYIKEWPNKMATLMTIDGVVLCTFNSTGEAQQVWRTWYQQQKTQSPSFVHSPTQPEIEAPDEINLEIIPCSTTFSNWLSNVAMACSAVKKITG